MTHEMSIDVVQARFAVGELPGGFSICSKHISEKLVLDLGDPATVTLFPDGNGFQGPLDDFK